VKGSAEISRLEGGLIGVSVDWSADLQTTGFGHIARSMIPGVTYRIIDPKNEGRVGRKPEILKPTIRPTAKFAAWENATPNRVTVKQLRRFFPKD
jgi:hypothetical protein